MKIGSTDSGEYVKFTPKYVIVGGECGVSFLLLLKWQTYFFGHLGLHANFQNRSYTPSGLYMKIESTDSGGYVKFTPKYVIVGGG